MTVDDDLETGLAKLAGREVPIRILKAQYQLPALKLQLDGVSQSGKRRWLFGFLKTRSKSDEAEDLRRTIAKAEDDWLVGILTPLTVADEQECDAHYIYAMRRLSKHPPELSTVEDRVAWAEALNMTANHSVLAKRIECALKVRNKEGLRRVLTYGEAKALDPRILVDLWNTYQKAFALTESELGKSRAPIPAT
jgi:hypothetical protein